VKGIKVNRVTPNVTVDIIEEEKEEEEEEEEDEEDSVSFESFHQIVTQSNDEKQAEINALTSKVVTYSVIFI
jgi:hypothetical protein